MPYYHLLDGMLYVPTCTNFSRQGAKVVVTVVVWFCIHSNCLLRAPYVEVWCHYASLGKLCK